MTALSPSHPCAGRHERCIEDALTRAQEVCRRRGVRLTPIRRRVLQLVWEDHRPVGAYELLERLRAEGWGSGPPLVYRALAFLAEQGLVHRLASVNAFIGCPRGGERHGAQFLICRDCGRVVEMDDRRLDECLAAAAEARGFTLEAPTIEVSGRCARCAEAA